ncbi:SPT16-domain-containing protein [Ascodesmis nigricans]|uniref:FACT complex subunit n=1 Tax=Ascodesmis nigricans TaxID=341454 RepID=A0A4S2N182_9PEZI|nr:SPT16-domain-containing protein [Ascodesmis nigricans]
MGDEVQIDKQVFHNRLANLIATWKDPKKNDIFGGVEALVIVLGKTQDGPYSKSLALQFWLLGYEFPATLFMITQEKFYIVTTAKKAKYLEPLKDGKTPIEFLIRGKDDAENKAQFEAIVEKLKKKKVGVVTKDNPQGPFAKEWKAVYQPEAAGIEEVDISVALSTVMSVKDEMELKTMRASSRAAVALMKDYFVDEMSKIIDEEKKITHEQLSTKIEAKIDDEKFFQRKEVKLGVDFDISQIDWTVGPVVQSGGHYDLKASAQSDNNQLHAGIILATMGLRYKSYSSQISRTFLIDPNKIQEKYYSFLTDLQWKVLNEVRDGAVCKDIYNKAIQIVRSKYPDLEKHFPKNIGCGIGIEARDNTLTISAKSNRVLKDGMTLCVTLGFHDLENPKPQDSKSKIYSLLITDTVRVTSADPLVFTGGCPKDLKETAFYFKDDEPEPKVKAEKPTRQVRAAAPKSTMVMKTKLRGERKEIDEGAEQRRKEHQKELAASKQREGLERFAESGSLDGGKGKKAIKKFESYKRENQLPSQVKDLKIVVDSRNQTVIVPIFGRPVPFHIATIKNVSKTEEDAFTYLRINLLSPGQGVGRKDDMPFEDPNANFLRSLTYRSTDNERIARICDDIMNLKKDATKREQERKEMEDVVTQDNLREVRNRRPQRLTEVFVRPSMETKRFPGEVEIHENGLRYQSVRGNDQRIDILFSNVKHLFFQPSAHELIVLIHIHLKDPIMIGKKKTKDVQFYREATDIQFDETGNRKRKYRYGDEEEFEQEQEERRRRAELDKEFKSFAERISEAAKKIEMPVDVDVPYRELGFNGVPFRANVLCAPTTDALVSLTDQPFLVITLDEIEIAHLERVRFGLKNFDLVFVYKDFARPVTSINSIPMESLENVKEWLDSSNIAYSEGPLNLNWPTIMKTVQSDPKQFFEDGGWSFLSTDSDAEDEESEEEESEFEASDFGEESDGSVSDESSYDEDASGDEGSAGSDEGSEAEFDDDD